jgi:serine/threonine-protein kinase RsbW
VSHLELVINSDLSDVSVLAVAVKSICLHLGLTEAKASQVELCTVEAVTNAIRHAYHGQPGNIVSVVVSSEIDYLQLDIVDSGTPMPAQELERLLHGSEVLDIESIDPASLAEGGRGLQIIHDLMDRVAYSSEGDRNRLQLTKRHAAPKRH